MTAHALRFNHVSVSAADLDASVRFYTELFGMERIPTPNFPDANVIWLRFGDQTLHLFEDGDPSPPRHHFSLDVDDFEGTYRRASELGVLDGDTFGADVRELVDGAVQMYLRDPAGNLVEVNWPDVETLDRSAFANLQRLEDQRPQSGEAAQAKLYVSPR
jgi:catechol 2,3-dioxygenase-like lactoylglutathione lyase family enzyme